LFSIIRAYHLSPDHNPCPSRLSHSKEHMRGIK
jgi:hypothetical protein